MFIYKIWNKITNSTLLLATFTHGAHEDMLITQNKSLHSVILWRTEYQRDYYEISHPFVIKAQNIECWRLHIEYLPCIEDESVYICKNMLRIATVLLFIPISTKLMTMRGHTVILEINSSSNSDIPTLARISSTSEIIIDVHWHEGPVRGSQIPPIFHQ